MAKIERNIIEIEQAKKIRDDLMQGEQAPSTRAQSYQHVYWEQLGDQLGQPFDATKIPISKLYQMRRDPMIAFALMFIKTPIIRAKWYIQCEDAQVAAFIDDALRKIYPRFVLQYLQCLDFGWSSIIKRFELTEPDATYYDTEGGELKPKPVWDEGKIEAVTWKTFANLPPEHVAPRWNADGEFNGIEYDGIIHLNGFPVQYKTNNSNTKTFEKSALIPATHSLWVTNEKESVHGSIYGYPRIGYAFRYWWSYWYRWALADRHFEKDADPAMVVYYPGDTDERYKDEEGNPINLREIALSLGQQARSGSTIAAPGDIVQKFADTTSTSNLREWDFKFLSDGQNFDAFNETFSYLDVQKLRSIMVPEQAFLEGRGGTSSRNVAATLGDVFEKSQAVIAAEIDDCLNRWVIPQLVYANFPERKVVARKITRGFGDEDMELAKQLITLIGQGDPSSLPVDMRRVLDEFGVPTISPEEEQRQKEQALQQAMEQAQATAVPTGETVAKGEPGKQAEVKASATGFDYIQPRERIELADDATLLQSWPKKDKLGDQSVLAAARELREAHVERYGDIYDGFADYVAALTESDVRLDESDEADSIADRIVNGFTLFGETVSKIAEKANGLLRKVIERSAELALGEVDSSTSFDADTEAVATWLQDHGAAHIERIDDTTRDELRTFVAKRVREGMKPKEIAEEVRWHFVDFPGWKANRVTRSEVKDAVNQATLQAAIQAGFERVQARDASNGADLSTDEECKRRHGRVFSVDDALKVSDHPNGTLQWRIMRTNNLSVEIVDEIICPIEDAQAYFNDETKTIWVRTDLSDDLRMRYLCEMGDKL